MSPTLLAEPLRPREICTVLYAQRQAADKYHWTICIPYSSTNVKKLHAKEDSADSYFYEEPIPDENLAASPTVCAVVKLGECTSKHTIDYIHDLLRAIPMQLPREDVGKESRFGCRVWWREAVRTLHRNGVIHCPDVHELEREVYQFAERNEVSQTSSRGYKYFVSRRSV